MTLPSPARFFPLAHGTYDVAAGLRSLGSDFGNGAADTRVFLFDANYPRYREAKLRARAERLETYFPQPVRLDPELRGAAVRFIAETLARESPEFFALKTDASGFELQSTLTQERFEFSVGGELREQETSVSPKYRDGLDALATVLQEDVALWQRAADGSEWLAAVHLCFPNHWAAEDKVGRAFNVVHAPVAGFGRLAKAAPSLIDGIITKGPFVRFAWGVATDAELNHHPRAAFQGRQFDPQTPELYLRIERQTLRGFPKQNGSIFTIRTYFLNCATELSAIERVALGSAIRSMTPEALLYKGLAQSRDAVLDWLKSLGG